MGFLDDFFNLVRVVASKLDLHADCFGSQLVVAEAVERAAVKKQVLAYEVGQAFAGGGRIFVQVVRNFVVVDSVVVEDLFKFSNHALDGGVLSAGRCVGVVEHFQSLLNGDLFLQVFGVLDVGVNPLFCRSGGFGAVIGGRVSPVVARVGPFVAG